MPRATVFSGFPAWFPPNCPPHDSDEASGVVFRFVNGDSIDPQDFLSHHELGLAPRAPACRRCSLSVYRTLGFARVKLKQLRDRFPGRFGTSIAAGQLAPELGMLKQEGADLDHHEWWAYDGVERQTPFRVVDAISP